MNWSHHHSFHRARSLLGFSNVCGYESGAEIILWFFWIFWKLGCMRDLALDVCPFAGVKKKSHLFYWKELRRQQLQNKSIQKLLPSGPLSLILSRMRHLKGDYVRLQFLAFSFYLEIHKWEIIFSVCIREPSLMYIWAQWAVSPGLY